MTGKKNSLLKALQEHNENEDKAEGMLFANTFFREEGL